MGPSGSIRELIKQVRSIDHFPSRELAEDALEELSIIEARLGMRAEQIDRDSWELNFLRSENARLQTDNNKVAVWIKHITGTGGDSVEHYWTNICDTCKELADWLAANPEEEK